MLPREQAILAWIKTLFKAEIADFHKLAGDASFRQYYRLSIEGKSYVIMDAPTHLEPLAPFIKTATIFQQSGVRTPQIYAQNEALGFLLLEDFGDSLLLSRLEPAKVDYYYPKAIDCLLQFQKRPIESALLPYFDQAFMMKECRLFKEWFINAYLSLSLTPAEEACVDESIDKLTHEIAEQPQVLIHRDYHSRNLMVVDDDLGLIDFQDAMWGPIGYDLVSLLKDCYISWDNEKRLRWMRYFHQRSPALQSWSFESFSRAFDLCGLQRHLKVLGIFSRLCLRDKKEGYLKDLPLTLHYVVDCSARYPEFKAFNEFLTLRVSLT